MDELVEKFLGEESIVRSSKPAVRELRMEEIEMISGGDACEVAFEAAFTIYGAVHGALLGPAGAVAGAGAGHALGDAIAEFACS